MAYWKLTTAAEIMSSKYKKITDDFYAGHNESFAQIEIKIKQAINRIHRL